MKIKKHFVTVGRRRIHYRRTGKGPAVLLLHASPVSSEVFELQISLFAKHFTAIAIDTPGYGMSDPLNHPKPEIEDFADALAETLDALGIEQCAVYGRHTGGSIAVEFARRHPKRTAMALADGYPMFTAEVRDDYLKHYLPDITPQWDGSHLSWLWFRYREQHVFWPWNKHDGAHRADQDVPDLAFLHRGVKEMLMAGNGYKVAYSAAFRHNGREAIDHLSVPVCFGARPGDSQFRTLKRFPASVWTQEVPRDKTEATLKELELLLRHPARGDAPSAPSKVGAIPGRATPRYVEIEGRQLMVRHYQERGEGTPLVVVPPLPGSSLLCESLAKEASRHRPVFAIDPPGHGDSDGLPRERHAIETYALAITATLGVLGVRRAYIYGASVGAAVAVEVARRSDKLVAGLCLEGPMVLTDAERAAMAPRWAPSADPVWDGHHLTTMWHHLRDQQLFYPWYEKTLAATRWIEPELDPKRLHAHVVEMIKHPESFKPAWDAAFAFPMRRHLAELATPLLLAVRDTDPFRACFDHARAVAPQSKIARLSPVPATAASAIEAFITDVEDQGGRL
ncbi:MAG: alpha/beta fold hydrolase [Alphaproteobacteria bacterium]|nr:alpha/beta fold hydrolase [Alphaproteobacteria bacterium]